MKIKNIDINKVIPYHNNPRKDQAVDKVASSINEYGFQQPIVVDKNMIVIVGHTRLLGAKKLGLKKVPVAIADLSETKAKAYRIADNRLNEDSEWDFDLLDIEVKNLLDEDYNIDLLGFENNELEQITKFDDVFDEQVEDKKVAFDMFSKDEIVEDCFNFYRKNGFPYRDLAIHTQKQKLNRLCNTSPDNLIRNSICSDVADTYHKHRYSLSASGMKSPVEAFNKDVDLKKAIRLEVEAGITLKDKWFGTLGLVNGTQACSNFRPSFAKYLYDKYCTENSVVLDTSTGFGGRLLGAMCSKKVKKYIGIDPSTKTYKANINMCNSLGFENKVELVNLPAEDVDIEKYKNSVNFSFTSPPYFSKEHYAEEKTQSFLRYPTYDEWVKNFLEKMITLQYKALKKNCYNLINIADVKIKNKTYNLVNSTIQVAEKVGFTHEKTENYELNHRFGNEEKDIATEPLLIFKK